MDWMGVKSVEIMDELGSPLILTKLRVPASRPRMLDRAQLVDLLSPENGIHLILVCAPAGYGKTSLLAAWAQSLLSKGIAVAWVALDPGDDNSGSFISYIIASFTQALGPIPELTRIAQLLRSSPEIDPQRILPSLINAIVSNDRKCVLILDDYHLIGSPAIHNMLADLLEHIPEHLRIAIGSRSDPPLPLARLRARRRLLEVRTANLRFTPQETAQFLNEVMHLDLSSEGVTALEERTEGWVTGLQLAALSLQNYTDKEGLIAAFSGSQRYLVDYLMEEVVNRQTSEVRSFLLMTSILERMCGGLCDAVRGEAAKGAEILNWLDRVNLFVVALDDRGDWYRYHHLFRDFLRTRLNKNQPEQIPSLHKTACEWLASKGLLREAAQHAFQTQDWEYAASFVGQHNFTLIVHGEIATIYEWCSAFPEEVMQRNALLCNLQGLALAYGYQKKNRARVEARLLQVDRLITEMEDRQRAREQTDLATIVRTFLAMAPDPEAEPKELLVLAQSILDAYPEGDGSQFSGLLLTGYAYLALHDGQAAGKAFEAARKIALREHLYFGIVESTFHFARLAHSQGQLQHAKKICLQGQSDLAAVLAHPEQELPALGSLEVELGCVLLEQDQLEIADQYLRNGLDLMGGGTNLYYLMTAYLALFRLYEIQNCSAEALNQLDRLEAVWPDMTFCMQGLRCKLALSTGPEDPSTKANAYEWSQQFLSSIDHGEFLPGMGPFGAAEAYYLASLTWAQIQIALGNPQPALAYLQKQLDRAQTNGLINRVIELSVLQAWGWRVEGDVGRAREALELALSMALPEGYMRTFDQGPALTQLLLETAEKGAYQEYAKSIINHMGIANGLSQEQVKPTYGSHQLLYVETLSERELEVLNLIALGATNNEIAERLVITVGTVKSHINHILGKLDSHNRTEAVARARALGLIEI